MKKMWARPKLSQRPDPAVRPLIESLWGSEAAQAPGQPEALAYLRHYKQVAHRSIPKRHPATPVVLSGNRGQAACFMKLVEIVKASSRNNFAEIKHSLEAENPSWLKDAHDRTLLEHAISAAIALWLFTSVDCEDDTLTLKDALQSSLPEQESRQDDILRDDFSAKTLSKACGFRFVWTSDLSKHLLFKPASREIHFFRHARAIDKLINSDCNEFFPVGFLEEAGWTICRFFPTDGLKDARRTRKLQEKFIIDLEAQMTRQETSPLKDYRYFGERLALIKTAYDLTRPRKVRQWWFDRRNRAEWWTLLIAIVVFVLTLIFGIISSVTGIIQAAASVSVH